MKRNTKLKFGDDVRVKWIDSFTTYGWNRPDGVDKIEVIESTGRVAVNRTDCLTITTSFSHVSDKVVDPLSIPWCSIKFARKVK